METETDDNAYVPYRISRLGLEAEWYLVGYGIRKSCEAGVGGLLNQRMCQVIEGGGGVGVRGLV